ADVDGHRVDFAPVFLPEPGNDDRGVESSGIGERNPANFLLHETVFSFKISSRLSMNRASASFGITYGGSSLRTDFLAVPTTNPFSRSRRATGPASRSSSIPHIRPRP